MKIQIDPERPNPRHIAQAVDALRQGGVIAYPTDTVYGFAANLFDKKAIDLVYAIKGKDEKKPLAFICNDIKDVSRYAIVGNHAYRLMRRVMPGPYTLVVRASREVPRTLTRRAPTLGVRMPDNLVARAIVEQLGNPIVSSSVPMEPGVDYQDPLEIEDRYGHQLALTIDSGIIYPVPSTILDLTDDVPRMLRQGKGPIDDLGVVELVE